MVPSPQGRQVSNLDVIGVQLVADLRRRPSAIAEMSASGRKS